MISQSYTPLLPTVALLVGALHTTSSCSEPEEPADCLAPWQGDRQEGTAQDDEILGLAVDSEDNLYLTGYENGTVGVSDLGPVGDSRWFVKKLSPAGELLWTEVLDTSATDLGESILIDASSGKLYVLGRTTGAFSGFQNGGQFDVALAVLDPDGGILSQYQGGNERPQHPRQLTLAGEDLVVAGFDDVYVPSNYVESWEDPFVGRLELETSGISETWHYQPYSSGSDLFSGVASGPDGEIYLAGSVLSGPEAGPFVLQFLSDGTPGWRLRISNIGVDAATAIGISPAGELFVAGATFASLGKPSYGDQDVFLVKLDPDTGTPLWTGKAGTAATDWPVALGFDPSGNIYLAGSTYGSFAGHENQGGEDLFALKFDASGELAAVWQSGTPQQDTVQGLAVDSCGRVFLGGFTLGALIDGATPAGRRDPFLLQAEL